MANISFVDNISSYLLADVMSKNVLTVYEGWSVKRLAGFFVKHGVSSAPVIAADDELVGVVTQFDVVKFESQDLSEEEVKRLSEFYCGPFGGELSADDIRHLKSKANENCTVYSIMTPNFSTVELDTPLEQTCRILVNSKVHRLFVTNKGLLVGVITANDILQRLLLQ